MAAVTDHERAVNLKERIGNRELTFGSWLQGSCPESAEIMAAAEFEWLVIDCEHGAIDRAGMLHLVRAVQGRGRVPLARVMSCDPLLSRQALDAGCAGVIIPHIEDSKVYAAFADKSTLPPHGSRGVGFFRANNYGLAFDEYAAALSAPILIPMIESHSGVGNLEDLLNSAPVDAILIGPYDLSASLGRPGDFSTGDFRDAVEHVLATCTRFGVAVGIHDVTPSLESLTRHVAQGFSLIACGMDTVFLSRSVVDVSMFIARLRREGFAGDAKSEPEQ